MTQDKLSAYQTLYTCLETISRLMAPIAPFFADQLFLDLNNVTGKDTNISVHLTKFPTYNENLINKLLENRMDVAQTITSMVLALRKKVNIKVRQPLSSIMIPILEDEMKNNIMAIKELIINEVNVKEIKFVDGSAGVLVKSIKPDFKKLGPKCGKNMKQIASMLQEMPQKEILEFEKNGSFLFTVNNEQIDVSVEDVEIFSEDIPGWLVANEGKFTVALDITITDELQKEGIARELINRIQNIRKSSGFDITDKIVVNVESHSKFNESIIAYNSYIASQTLANSIKIVNKVSNSIALEIEKDILNISIEKI